MKEETMIHQNARRIRLAATLTALALSGAGALAQAPPREARDEVLATMKRATTFMTEKLAYKGGYVWNYLPDLSRRWGEMEARETMIWIQPPGTATVGHLYLDAYHATGDNFYYQAAEQVAGALIWAQHPSGGWNYVADFAGERSLKEWYETVGKNGWRLEEFQHYWGNATFDDAGTAESAKFLLRLYIEKRDPKYRPSLDKAIQFVLDSQYPIGAWPQRYPRVAEHSTRGLPDYTAYPTFNDDVAGENIDFLVMCYQTLGDARLVDPILRGMNAFIVTQQGPPQPGWSLQYLTRSEAGAGPHLRTAIAGDPHDRAQPRADGAVLPAHGRHEISGAHTGGDRLAGIDRAAAGRGAGRPHARHLHRGGHQQAVVHPP